MDIIIDNEYKNTDYFSQIKGSIDACIPQSYYLLHNKKDVLDIIKNGVNKIVFYNNIVFKKRNFSTDVNEIIKTIPNSTKKYICFIQEKLTIANIKEIKNKIVYLETPLHTKDIYEIIKNKDKVVSFQKVLI